MSTKVFEWLTPRSGADVYGHDLTTSVTGIEPGLLVVLDAAGNTVSLAAATGSKPFGFAYGNRDLVYAPDTKVYDNGEAVNALIGHGIVAMSADFFSTGSLPAEAAGGHNVFAAANGLIAITGANQIGRILDQKSYTDPADGTGTSVTVALIEFDFGGAF